jgi:SAM-dependent methyltransferase
MSEPTYQDRIRAQIEQYAETVNMHDLPEAFHIWSHKCIGSALNEVFGTYSIDEVYALAYIEARQREAGDGRILSIGCGDGGVEIRVAKILLERGVNDFVFVCADLSPILLGHLERAVAREGLDAHFRAVEADLNNIAVPGAFDVIMANHSLHHIKGLERLFTYSRERLKNGGIFATSDMIGRNGHMRWPETAAIVQAIWPVLDPKQRYHYQLQRYSDAFIDHDCSTEGFEGIRAQDILPIMLKVFHPYKFVGVGGVADLFVDRGYGHGFDVNNEEHVAFVRFLSDLNDILLDAGLVKPTWMMAYFTKDNRGEFFYRDRRAINSLRTRGKDPRWTRFYPLPEHT